MMPRLRSFGFKFTNIRSILISYKALVILLILIGFVITFAFVVALYHSSTDAIAQALGNLVGAAAGTIGAFTIAVWTVEQGKKQLDADRDLYKSLIAQSIRYFIVRTSFIYHAVNHHDYPDGRITSEIAQGFYVDDFSRFNELREKLYMLGSDVFSELEHLHQGVEQLHKRLNLLQSAVSDDRQRAFFVQLDHTLAIAANLLDLLSRPASNVFAKQAQALHVFTFLPFPPEPFKGKIEILLYTLNKIAFEHDAENRSQQ